MNKILKKMLIIVMLMFSTSTFAITTNAYTAPESCNRIIEYSKDVAKDSSKLTNSPLLISNLIACNLDTLPKSITADIMYSLFGENISIPLNMVHTFAKSINSNNSITSSSIDKIDLNNYMKGRVQTFPMLTATIEGFSLATFQVLGFLIISFMGYYLISSMSEGSFLGKAHNTFWTSIKHFIILAMLMPVSGVGLNFIQLLIISLAFIGSFLASLMWSILPMFKYIYLTDFNDVDPDLKTGVSISSSNIISNLVLSNMCDISMRQNILLNTTAKNYTQDLVSNTDFYNCLSGSFDDVNEKEIGYSSQLNKTKYCAMKKATSLDVNCGSITINKNNTELNEYMLKTIYPETRAIAKKIIGSACLKNEKLKDGNANLYYKYCSDIDNITFNSEYKNNQIISTVPLVNYDETNAMTDINKLSVLLTKKLEGTITTTMFSDDALLKQISSHVAYSLNKGWLNAGTFLFDVGASTNVKNEAFMKTSKSITYNEPEYKQNSFQSVQTSLDPDSNSSLNTDRMAVSIYYNFLTIKGSIVSKNKITDLFNIIRINKDLKELGIEKDLMLLSKKIGIEEEEKKEKTSKSLNDYIFPSLGIIKEFNKSSNPADYTDCSSDYSNCSPIPVNPIASIIDKSREALGNASLIAISSSLLSYGLDSYRAKIDQQVRIGGGFTRGYFLATATSLILDFVSLIMGLQIILSLVVGYLLPIVLFIYFIGNSVSWLITVAFAIIGAPIWMGMHLIPSKEKSFGGHAKKGYLMIMDVLLKPSFIVIGVFCSFIITIIMIVILNTSFSIVINTFSMFENPTSITQVFNNFVINALYLIFLSWVFFKSAKATYKIPNSLQKWLSIITYEDAGVWREITKISEKVFMNGIKKYLIFM